ncbi:MAG TPA: PaaI family thioesterase [Nevskia sp.]|nr:PaaI family thioesterase [Nevskia sp.]
MSTEQFYNALRRGFAGSVPHVKELGIELSHADARSAEGRLPYRPEFLGDAEHQLIHTGVVTTLIDSVCGVALIAHIGQPTRIATLDLRVDYLRPSRPGKDLVCRAECYRLTDQIAFLRASVWQDRADEPVATSLAAFMRTGKPGDPAQKSGLR